MNNPNTHLFNYCPHCGDKNLTADGVKSFLCCSCNFKFYLNTAAAGIALIFNKGNEILVTKRKYNPAKGLLDFPGGFAEPGETIEECLIREIREELNLSIASTTYFCSVPNTYTYQTVTYAITDVAFICRVDDFTPIRAGDDISEYCFLDLSHIDPSQFGLDSPRILLDRLRKKPLPDP